MAERENHEPTVVDRRAVKRYVDALKKRYERRTGQPPEAKDIVQFGKTAWRRRGFQP